MNVCGKLCFWGNQVSENAEHIYIDTLTAGTVDIITDLWYVTVPDDNTIMNLSQVLIVYYNASLNGVEMHEIHLV